MKFSKELQTTIDIALEAGNLMMSEAKKIRNGNKASSHISYKNVKGLTKHEIVTTVDKKVDNFIISKIKERFPKDYLLTEESYKGDAYQKRKTQKRIWLVDPIDGTSQFTKYLLKKTENKYNTFSISIALAVNDKLKLGLVFAPYKKEMFVAEKNKGSWYRKGNGNWKKNIIGKKTKFENISLAISAIDHDKVKAFISNKKKIRTERTASIAYKLSAISRGRFDGYVTMTDRPKEWDIAAGHLILEEAGGTILREDENQLLYNKNNVGIESRIAAGNKTLATKLMKQLQLPTIMLIGSITHSTPVYENGEIRERWGGGVMYGGLVASKLKIPTIVITAGSTDIEPGIKQLAKNHIQAFRIKRSSSNNFSNDYSKPKRVLRMRSIMKKPITKKELDKLALPTDITILNPIYHEVTPDLCQSISSGTVILDIQGLTRETRKRKDGFYHLIKHRWDKLMDYKKSIDILKMSDEDLDNIDLPKKYRTVKQKLQYLANNGFSTVILTQGHLPTLVARKNKPLKSVSVAKVKAVDTGGAGDSFNIGFAYGYNLNKDAVESAAYGNAAASFMVSHVGTKGLGDITAVSKRAHKILKKIK